MCGDDVVFASDDDFVFVVDPRDLRVRKFSLRAALRRLDETGWDEC